MNMYDLLQKTRQLNASDLHITVGHPPVMRINGVLTKYTDQVLLPEDNLRLVKEILDTTQFNKLEEYGEIDTSVSYSKLGRFRVNVFKQRNTYGIAIRCIHVDVPTIEELGLPSVIKDLTKKQRGLILVTGPTGSGKSTTLAAMIDCINKERSCHILTLEDPIEYLHKHKKSIINQREIGTDSKSFSQALRSALRQDPDVILVGEMRDLETMSIALTAAETGHLVLSTLHTIGAAKTIDRIIDSFPSHHKQQIIIQLSTILEGVISQQLLPTLDGKKRVAALEIMIATPAIRNLIRENKTHQIQTAIQTGAKFGMKSMDASLSELYMKGYISKETMINHAVDKDMIERYI
ncbi:twitching motility protein PilT [Alkalithermobacter thermoalcaliphilus JW-YL-7 = DSM 7308]|uniref:Twitching motility protein n=1 Tax=Alkalithermobacter thermoalcaliphilus JW-YL-7 = DSM 7308 TaxID=1121328 RepID=A0A150FT49_CLOPD|nr:twitching motility protein [[Clostridium] paradoxum JW-YL-7 = DSM 7308]KXZ40797.1 twitching motility protein [[Clostridium] paradoxum JW-YL-7 = DSM 7308]SHL36967.1 twitching motility protein PilT [[Clostridium] paradoxum JW-YL-7 = DSM 7308]